jgi:two-component system, LytTR family, response regulator
MTNLNPENQLIVKFRNKILCLPQTSLICIKANRSYSILTLEDNKAIKLSKPMSWIKGKVEEELFIHCHRSFYINRLKIQSIDLENRVIYLTNGFIVPISSRKLACVKRLIQN